MPPPTPEGQATTLPSLTCPGRCDPPRPGSHLSPPRGRARSNPAATAASLRPGATRTGGGRQGREAGRVGRAPCPRAARVQPVPPTCAPRPSPPLPSCGFMLRGPTNSPLPSPEGENRSANQGLGQAGIPPPPPLSTPNFSFSQSPQLFSAASRPVSLLLLLEPAARPA